MTAPAAPVIKVRTNGLSIRVGWHPVPNATDYKLYVGPTTNPSGLEADVSDDGEGWFQYTFVPEDDDEFVALTALNIGAEESAHSNEVRITSVGLGSRITKSDPFGAYDRRDR